MFRYTNRELTELANANGFIKNTTEKILRLIDVLEFIGESRIGSMLALKGGTAINLCLLDLPRLSVDIDMDFTLPCSKDDMIKNRKEIKNTISGFMQDEGYLLSDRSKFVYTLDSFVYSYFTLSGSRDVLKIEINYSDRIHILRPIIDESICVLDRHCIIRRLADEELIGSKINALLVRTTPRDVYDVYNLLKKDKIKDRILVKKIAIFYAVLGSEKPVDFDNILEIAFQKMQGMNYNKIRESLLPVLHKGEKIVIEEITEYVIAELSNMFELESSERKYIEEYNAGCYKPELLFEGIETNDISNHPMALWKVKK